MHDAEEQVSRLLNRLASTPAPQNLEVRVLRTCRSRFFNASRRRRRNTMRFAAICTIANIALGVAAFRMHRRHRRLVASLSKGLW